MVAAFLFSLSRDQKGKMLIFNRRLCFNIPKQISIVLLSERKVFQRFSYLSLHANGSYLKFNDCEGVTSYPHSLVLDVGHQNFHTAIIFLYLG